MSYFNDPWNIPSPSNLMEGIGNPRMAILLSATEVAYSIVQQASANSDLAPPHELYTSLEPL
jgi:hypothetical protein